VEQLVAVRATPVGSAILLDLLGHDRALQRSEKALGLLQGEPEVLHRELVGPFDCD
jgi:hypothetical protein